MSLLFPNTQHRFVRNGVPVITGSTNFDLQETLPWWKITQGGVYSHNLQLIGLHVGSHPSPWDHLDETNIVTRFSMRDPGKAGAFPSRLRIAVQALQRKWQVGVILHRNHAAFAANGFQLPAGETLALAGYWVVTDVWIDWEGLTSYLMIRLEKVTTDGVWWGSATAAASPGLGMSPPALNVCPNCQNMAPSRYNEGFLCGSPDCASSDDNTTATSLGATRTYSPNYLAQRSSMAGIPPPPTAYLPAAPRQWTRPEYIALYQSSPDRFKLGRHGYYCPQCAVLSQKIHFDRLECRKCQGTQPLAVPALTFEDLVDDQWLDLRDNSNIPGIVIYDNGAEEITPRILHPKYVIRRWRLDTDDCVIWLVLPKRQAIYEVGGFKELFNRFSAMTRSGTFPLRRFLTQSTIPHQRTAWFGRNTGVEYASRMQMGTTSFADADPIITEFVAKMTAIVTDVTGTVPRFNENLSIADIGDAGMSWHSDGENTVIGDHIVSTSLGGPGVMSFRLNDGQYKGQVTGTVNTTIPIRKGCYREADKRVLKAQADAGTITQAEHSTQLTAMARAVLGKPPTIIDFPIPGTGAIVIQEGLGLGTYYHHTAHGRGMLRLVNTARFLRDPLETKDNKRKADTDNSPSPKRRKRGQGPDDSDLAKPPPRRSTRSSAGRQRRPPMVST